MKLHIAYIAGFLDADGTITCNMHKQTKSDSMWFKPQVEFCNQDLVVLKAIRETLESGVIRAYKVGKSGAFRLSIPMRDCKKVLERMIPYLVSKKEQAVLLIEGLNLKQPRGRVIVPVEITEMRIAINQRIHELNHRNSKDYQTNWVKSVNPQSTLVMGHWTIPSQASEGEIGSEEGVTTRMVSPNNNPSHERPTGNGRDSLNSTVM